MMFPPLARVRYEDMGKVFRDWKVLGLSLLQNWLIGPILMFALAIIFLPDHPEYMVGLIMIGLARCIAMVIVGTAGTCVRDVAVGGHNSVVQISSTASTRDFITCCRPFWLSGSAVEVSMRRSHGVMIYSASLFRGIADPLIMLRAKGETGIRRVIPLISQSRWCVAVTIVVLFILKGNLIVRLPMSRRVVIPLNYFVRGSG